MCEVLRDAWELWGVMVSGRGARKMATTAGARTTMLGNQSGTSPGTIPRPVRKSVRDHSGNQSGKHYGNRSGKHSGTSPGLVREPVREAIRNQSGKHSGTIPGTSLAGKCRRENGGKMSGGKMVVVPLDRSIVPPLPYFRRKILPCQPAIFRVIVAFEVDEELQLLGLKVSCCLDGLQEVVYGRHVHVDA